MRFVLHLLAVVVFFTAPQIQAHVGTVADAKPADVQSTAQHEDYRSILEAKEIFLSRRRG